MNYFRMRFASPRFIFITVSVLLALTAVPAWRLIAQETQALKPLPKFLRRAIVADRYLGTRDVDELLRYERVEPVCLQLVKRPQVPRPARMEALRQLAELRSTDGATELLPWIEYWDQLTDEADPASGTPGGSSKTAKHHRVLSELASLLPEQTRAALEGQRERLVELATQGKHAPTRQGALIALIQADASVSQAWQLAEQRDDGLLDLLGGLRWLPPVAPRAALFKRLRPLLDDADHKDVRRAAIASVGSLDVEPREVFETLAGFVAQDVLPEACVPSICQIPSEFWTEPFREPLAAGLVRNVQDTPLAQRTSAQTKQTIELIRTIAQMLPTEQSAPLLRSLAAASVKEIHIRTVEEKMAYDQTVIIVQAGQGVQITLENDDIMPHNLVIVDSPAAREEVGIAADRMQNEPDALARGYLPDSPHILHATKLLYPKQKEVLTLTAPTEPGVYAYLCTFPGHWSKMYGALVVAEDAAAYRVANTPLPTADELLGIRTVEWTYEQLAAELPKLQEGRSFANGEKNFLKASCFACHQMRQQGGRIGPDLTKIREKYKTPEEVLQHVMAPSEKVDEQYATVIVEMSDGQVYQGVMVDETDAEIRISENPLVSCEPLVFQKDDIEDLSRSRLSPMPEQLLNTLVDAKDVLDLLAYVISGGDPQHEFFQ